MTEDWSEEETQSVQMLNKTQQPGLQTMTAVATDLRGNAPKGSQI